MSSTEDTSCRADSTLPVYFTWSYLIVYFVILVVFSLYAAYQLLDYHTLTVKIKGKKKPKPGHQSQDPKLPTSHSSIEKASQLKSNSVEFGTPIGSTPSGQTMPPTKVVIVEEEKKQNGTNSGYTSEDDMDDRPRYGRSMVCINLFFLLSLLFVFVLFFVRVGDSVTICTRVKRIEKNKTNTNNNKMKNKKHESESFGERFCD